MYLPFVLLFFGASVAALWWALVASRRSGIRLAQGERERGSRRDRVKAEEVVQGLGLE